MEIRLCVLVEKFLQFMVGRNAPGTIGYYRRHVERFAAHVGDVPISDLRKHHLLSWGKSWHAIQAVQRLFEWAHSEVELIDRNPFKGIKRPRLGNRRRVLSRVEMVRLLRGSSPEFRAFLLALRETIARPQEMRAVRWEQIRWDGQQPGPVEAISRGAAFFELWDYKSKSQRRNADEPRIIFINARLGRLLLRISRKHPDLEGPIFTNVIGHKWTNNAIRLRMRRLCRRLKMVADNRGEPIVAYTLRHTAATNATAAGIPDRILAEIMGHTSTRTTSRYQHLCRKHLRDAIKKFLSDK